ncbi:hypothetical protein SAMN05443247_07629 [Bradyrhizobium erythrophlei]|nr:hypothetical protein SAMN05443247_07629 [Bradyrhizobium erythrophlei]
MIELRLMSGADAAAYLLRDAGHMVEVGRGRWKAKKRPPEGGPSR